MKPFIVPIIFETMILSTAKNRKIIALNLAEASLYDVKAEKQLKGGNFEQAAYYTILSQEYLRIASEAKVEDIKLHAQYK
jgi:hypothetical protein